MPPAARRGPRSVDLDVGRQPSDFNGDGYADLLVGAPGERSGVGVVYVFHGPDLSVSGDLTNPFGAEGGGAFFGMVPAHAGDLTADGYADVVVGCEFDDVDGLTNAGRAWFCPPGFSARAAWRRQSVRSEARCPNRQGRFGAAVAAGCDIDGSGVATSSWVRAPRAGMGCPAQGAGTPSSWMAPHGSHRSRNPDADRGRAVRHLAVRRCRLERRRVGRSARWRER